MWLVVDLLLDAGVAGGAQRGDQQPEAGDRNSERVDVDPVHAVECLFDELACAQAGGVALPAVMKTVEGSQ